MSLKSELIESQSTPMALVISTGNFEQLPLFSSDAMLHASSMVSSEREAWIKLLNDYKVPLPSVLRTDFSQLSNWQEL